MVVADGGTLYVFDGEERPTGAVPLATILPDAGPDAGPVLGIVVQKGKITILTGGGLRSALDFNVKTH